jgi:ribonuclease III
MNPLYQKLHYTFQNKAFLEEALRHSSFVNEQPDSELRDNERFEFLGDAVLNLTISHLLMQRYPDLKEGDLSRLRAALVNESRLASIARKLDLGSYLQLGKGELQTNGREKQSILADTFEAMIAAIYLDGGFDVAFNAIRHHFGKRIDSCTAPASNQDYKSRLQELVQEKLKRVPRYKVIHESGPDHDKTFSVSLTVRDLTVEGQGKSKKTAEQDAARNALEILEDEDSTTDTP